jgi:hypothetical protein
MIWALSDSESPRHRRWYQAAEAVLVTMSISVLSVAAVLAVATARVGGDRDACDVRWGGSDPEAIQCSPELDVTVGTTQLVGDHPPPEGTGVMFGGRFLQPPPTIPLLPG